MQTTGTPLRVVIALCLLVIAQATLPPRCTVVTPQPAGQPHVEFCAYESLNTSESFMNLYDEDIISTAYCLAREHARMIIPGSCGCPNSCGDHGTCVFRANKNSCQCQSGWKGADCSVVSCSQNTNPCQNGGKCVSENGIDVCACAVGYNLMDCSGKDKVYTKLPNATSPQYKSDDYKDDHPLFDISTVTTVRIYMPEEDLFTLITRPGKKPISVQSIHIKNKRLSVVNNGTIQRGGDSAQYFAKKSFKFKFTDKFMKVKYIKLKGAEFDSSFIRETMSIAVARSMGIPVGRNGYAALYINDVFRGVYIILEDKKANFLESRFGDEFGITCDRGGCDIYNDDFIDLQTECSRLTGNINVIKTFLDTSMYLKSVAVDAMTGNWDGWKNRNNFAFYQPTKTGQLFVPFRWDFDASWGFDYWQPQKQSSYDVFEWFTNNHTFCPYLFIKGSGYRPAYIAHIKYIATTWLAPKGPAEVFARELHEMLLPFAVQDKWHALDYDHTPQAFLGSLDVDVTEPFKTQSILSFIATRYKTALKQIA